MTELNDDVETYSACKEFVRMYYGILDNQRHLVGDMYVKSPNYIWNANDYHDRKAIQKHVLELPMTDHYPEEMDIDAIPNSSECDSTTFIIMVSGIVQYEEEPLRHFRQIIFVTVDTVEWKIVSDCYRLLSEI